MSMSDHIADLFKKDIFDALLASEMCDDQAALELSDAVFKRIRAKWGGKEVYIKALGSDERNKSIRLAFTGTNHAEVCRQFDISLKTLYRALSVEH